MPEKQYRALPGINKSGVLDRMAVSPAHYRYGPQTRQTEEMRFGTALHTLVLEPDVFSREYLVQPALPNDLLVTVDHIKAALKDRGLDAKGTKDVLTARLLEQWPDAPFEDVIKARWEKENKGIETFESGDWDKLHRMRDSLLHHPRARQLLDLSKDGNQETVAVWVDEETGLTCKCKLDIVAEPLKILADIKTTKDASADGFAKSCGNFRYHVQDALYSQGFLFAGGFEVQRFEFILVEKTALHINGTWVHPIAVRYLDNASVEAGLREVRRDLDLFDRCTRANFWPAYPLDPQPVTLPVWTLKTSKQPSEIVL